MQWQFEGLMGFYVRVFKIPSLVTIFPFRCFNLKLDWIIINPLY